MFFALVCLVNIKVAISSKQITFWSILMVVLSIGSFFIVFGLMSFIEFFGVYGIMQHTYMRLQTWIVTLFFSFSYVLIDWGMQMVDAEIKYFMSQRILAIEREKYVKNTKDKNLDKKRYSNLDYSGYAFSGATGQDNLVTDKLSNRLKEAMYKQIFGNRLEPTMDAISEQNRDSYRTKSYAPIIKESDRLDISVEDQRLLHID